MTTILAVHLLVGTTATAQAAEQELEQGPAPGSVFEIKSPSERIFRRHARRQRVFDQLAKAIDKWPAFFADAELEARFRSYYRRKEDTAGILSEAWAMGGSVYLRSGWLADIFSLEAELFTSQPIIADEDRGGTGLLAPTQDDYTVLGVANAKLRSSGLELTGYRQILTLPYVNRNDFRMTPNTFEALILEKAEGVFRFTTGYVWKIKRRNSEDFIDMTEAVGVDEERGLGYAGLVYEPNENLQVGASVSGVHDVFMGLYADSVYAWSLGESVGLRAEGQLTYQQSVGRELLPGESFETWNLGLRMSSSWKGLVARLGMSFTGDQASIMSPYGSNPSYVDLMQRTFNAADEKALLLSLSYNFEEIGVPGLSSILNFAQGWGGQLADGERDSREFDFTVDYRVPEKHKFFQGLWLRVRASWLRIDGREQDATDVRVIFRYEFQAL